ncbi:hypothetical protein Cflav_PD5358 [Pedosphaera parvula Ellin514]|uniref:Uncharacterized protein n=2 Tax=Pedosphaera TaxID=1032526 RepID=B9XB38_PEDPL|nr:hypothetical protein Cflav_PD5358 [Pedosphaera parvula Ellin514]
MSLFVSLLAACIQSVWVLNRHGYDKTQLWQLLHHPIPEIFYLLIVEVFITFVTLWCFMIASRLTRWPILLLCCAFWVWFGSIIAKTKGYAPAHVSKAVAELKSAR